MTSRTNLFRSLLALMPDSPTLLGTVSVVNTSANTSTVVLPGGAVVIARGVSVAVGHKCWVRANYVEGAAPDLPLVEIEV